MKVGVPEKCTLCGGSFEKDGKNCAFPYPPKHYLCVDCLMKSSDEGLVRLNKRLATRDLDLSVEEIADIISPQSFNDRIKNADFVNDIPHFYECRACGLKSHSRRIIIDHQLDDCDHIGYLEDSK